MIVCLHLPHARIACLALVDEERQRGDTITYNVDARENRVELESGQFADTQSRRDFSTVAGLLLTFRRGRSFLPTSHASFRHESRLLHTPFSVPIAQSFTVPFGFRLVGIAAIRDNQTGFISDIPKRFVKRCRALRNPNFGLATRLGYEWPLSCRPQFKTTTEFGAIPETCASLPLQ